MNLQEASIIAVKYCYKLQPHCEIINIAGGVRRKKPEPHDIEIICIPKVEIVYDLFGNEFDRIRGKGFTDVVNDMGKTVKGNSLGKMTQIQLPEGIMLDLFMPDDFDYYRQYAIRTGSADYSHKVIATAWKKKGWCGSDEGLRKMNDCIEMKDANGKSKWKCVKPGAAKPPSWKSEEEFFNWIGVKVLRPKERN